MLTLTVTVEGKTQDDLTLALKEVLAKVEGDYSSGSDSNDSGSYRFDVTGEEEGEPAYTCERCGMATDNEDDVNFTKDSILCHDCYAEREAEMGDDTSWQ
jgi:hypothetical protein